MADNRRALLIASFLTLIAAGVGFAIRSGGILEEWGTTFGFTKQELGKITGFGLAGFGLTIMGFSLVADRVGYKALLVIAFLLHVSSAVVTYAAVPMFGDGGEAGKTAAYYCLMGGAFIFSLANGVCEAAINPLVAALYPKQKTHYLNILHAGWPGGLIIGGILAYCFVGRDAAVMRLGWYIPMSFFLVPTLIYGLLVLREKFPKSETEAAGVSFAEMLTVFASPILLLLLLMHAMIGYVELGTDSWITDIMNNVIPGNAILLFIYTSALMFVLRFFAGPIVERINPLGLLCLSAILGCVGLYWLGTAGGIAVIAAATVYGLGKTFLWPTILGVVGERFPKGGALVMGAMGGVGMLSAGLLGGPAIGTKQDYFASKHLKEAAPETFDRYRAEEEKSFYGLTPPIAGLDGGKVGALKDKLKNIERKEKLKEPLEDSEKLTTQEEEDKDDVLAAGLYGGRMALKWTALVPFSMFIGFLILVLYFRAQGGYKQEHLHQLEERAPMEA